MGFVGRYVPAAVEIYPGTDAIDEYGEPARTRVLPNSPSRATP
ncbi:hypothetical protein GCM10010359_04410 [Streptomyces morookaense]|nr:hypothetical protein GCM10010359_04410 [Streptomyces morookaense]